MTAIDILLRLERLQVLLRVDGDTLVVTPPRYVTLPPDVIGSVRARKPELIAELRRRAGGGESAADPMLRAFQAAGFGIKFPADPKEARKRLHALLSYLAPRPKGVPTGVDLVVALGGRAPRPRLLCSYEPWPNDPSVPRLRWRRAGAAGGWQPPVAAKEPKP